MLLCSYFLFIDNNAWNYIIYYTYLIIKIFSENRKRCGGTLARADIHQLNLIMEILGTPRDEFMQKILSESVSNFYYIIIRSRKRENHK